MQSFLSRHASQVKGVLGGFDRVRFRGTIRWLASVRGMESWLAVSRVLLKDFKDHAMGLTKTIREHTRRLAEREGRPVRYLASSALRKEDVAREIAEADGVTGGLVCVLTCVEPCLTFTVGPNRAKKKLEVRAQHGKCLHQYFYLVDPELGWLNVRLQTWFPFTVQIVLNGREWLARQLVRRGIPFERRDNCFVDLADVPAAQRLMDAQLETDWPRLLNRLVWQVHTAHRTLFGRRPLDYYWSADETEWATDVMFRSPADLARLYPPLVRHAMTSFRSGDVLRFLGKRPRVGNFAKAEILSHLGTREEGVRVKHALDRNSVKMYDKHGSVLRVETTVNHPRGLKVYRASENDPDGPQSWQRLRKGVADLHRRAEISRNSNERYLESLAATESDATLAESAAGICRRTRWHGRPARALNPLAEEDARLLEAVARGEFAIAGFRNRDLQALLFAGAPNSPKEARRRTAKVTRLIRLLRAHGLVHKLPRTHRYQLSPAGRSTIAALLTARQSSSRRLTELAA